MNRTTRVLTVLALALSSATAFSRVVMAAEFDDAPGVRWHSDRCWLVDSVESPAYSSSRESSQLWERDIADRSHAHPTLATLGFLSAHMKSAWESGKSLPCQVQRWTALAKSAVPVDVWVCVSGQSANDSLSAIDEYWAYYQACDDWGVSWGNAFSESEPGTLSLMLNGVRGWMKTLRRLVQDGYDLPVGYVDEAGPQITLIVLKPMAMNPQSLDKSSRTTSVQTMFGQPEPLVLAGYTIINRCIASADRISLSQVQSRLADQVRWISYQSQYQSIVLKNLFAPQANQELVARNSSEVPWIPVNVSTLTWAILNHPQLLPQSVRYGQLVWEYGQQVVQKLENFAVAPAR